MFKNDGRVVLPYIPQEVTQESWFVFVLRLNLEWLSQFLNIPKWVQDFDIPIRIEGEKKSKRMAQFDKAITCYFK